MKEGGVFICSGDGERSDCCKVGTPGSNPNHNIIFYFLIFSATTNPGTQSSKFTIIVIQSILTIQDNQELMGENMLRYREKSWYEVT